MLKHIGIRPRYQMIQEKTRDKFYYYEELPGGLMRQWTLRMLKSGCNEEVEGIERDGLIYCQQCDEWFSKSQFK